MMAPEVAACGVAVEAAEDVPPEATGDIDEEQVPLEAALVDDTDAVVVQDEAVGAGVTACFGGEGVDKGRGPWSFGLEVCPDWLGFGVR